MQKFEGAQMEVHGISASGLTSAHRRRGVWGPEGSEGQIFYFSSPKESTDADAGMTSLSH